MSQEQIKALFDYKDGNLHWKSLRRKPKGLKAGHIFPSGYTLITYKGKTYRAHRLVWTMFNGEIPQKMLIDHIDQNRSNNKIENLRLVTTSLNARNTKQYATSTSGVKGVYWHKGMKKWCARIYTAPYKMVVLGYSESLEEAARMRKEAEPIYGYL